MQRLEVNVETGEETVVDLTPDEVIAIQATNVPLVPQQAPLWAVRATLKMQGLFDQADAAVKASGNVPLQSLWEYGDTVYRSSSTLEALANSPSLGLTDAQVDALFVQAAALTV
jgi:hypothetical protein